MILANLGYGKFFWEWVVKVFWKIFLWFVKIWGGLKFFFNELSLFSQKLYIFFENPIFSEGGGLEGIFKATFSHSHRCTRVENPGEGVRDVFAKIPRGGVKGFRKNCQGGSTYFAFYCIFINKFFENFPGGVLFHTPLPPYPPPPLCASMPIPHFLNSCVDKASRL